MGYFLIKPQAGGSSSESRDFTKNPLDLDTESKGALSKTRYEKQNAAETAITDASNNFEAENVEDALTELFTYADSGKKKVATAVGSPATSTDTFDQLAGKIDAGKQDIASAITEKGTHASETDTLGEFASKIRSISTGGGGGSAGEGESFVTAKTVPTMKIENPSSGVTNERIVIDDAGVGVTTIPTVTLK